VIDEHRPTALVRRRELAAGVGLWLAGAGADAAPLERGQPVVWPTLTLLDGSRLQPVDWVDTAAVVVFWATWCAFCRRHNARIEKLHQATNGKRLRVLAVAVESEEAGVRSYLQAHGLHFPAAMVTEGLREQFTTRRTVPMTALVDRRGRLLQTIPGEMSEDDVLALAALARAPTA
jgi:thiol-disulfide isomerase/thioredoxin